MLIEKSDIDKVLSEIREERIKRRDFTLKLNNELEKLKANEPSSDNPFYRLAIIGYEISKVFGSLEHAIVYMERFKNNPEVYKAEYKNAQVEIGDCLAMLHLLCITYSYDYFETRMLGFKHLEERQKDFEQKGWIKIE